MRSTLAYPMGYPDSDPAFADPERVASIARARLVSRLLQTGFPAEGGWHRQQDGDCGEQAVQDWLLRPEKRGVSVSMIRQFSAGQDSVGRKSPDPRPSRCQGADLDQVVCQDPVADPDLGAFGAVDAGAVPAVSAFEGADSPFASVAPLDCSPKRWSVFLCSPTS